MPESEKENLQAQEPSEAMTGSSKTVAASITISREAAEDALDHAWNAGVSGAWRRVREMFTEGVDVQQWAITVEKHSPPVAAEWQQARALLRLADNQGATSGIASTAASPALKETNTSSPVLADAREAHRFPGNVYNSAGALGLADARETVDQLKALVLERLCDCDPTARFNHDTAQCMAEGVRRVDQLILAAEARGRQ